MTGVRCRRQCPRNWFPAAVGSADANQHVAAARQSTDAGQLYTTAGWACTVGFVEWLSSTVGIDQLLTAHFVNELQSVVEGAGENSSADVVAAAAVAACAPADPVDGAVGCIAHLQPDIENIVVEYEGVVSSAAVL